MHVIIVGAGIAGLSSALDAAAAGHTVTLAVKGVLGGGSTPLAQGGIAGVYGAEDSAALHAADTLTAGAGLSDPVAVEALVEGAAAAIDALIHRGVPFDRTDDGEVLRGREAAHAHPRIAHAGGDATGAAMTHALVQRVRESARVEVVEHAFLTDLVSDGDNGSSRRRCRGIRILVGHDPDAATLRELHADAVILATGGAGQMFLHTTNPVGATGDGIAVALRAGVAVADLEFMQFHPTMLATPVEPGTETTSNAPAAFLVSEAVRGEGATLRNRCGRRFVFDTHPDGELAPRDVVARAIARQAAADGTPVVLDATALGAEFLAHRFPTIDRVTRERGLHWGAQPIPVTPAAHYYMGGIVTDIDGRTTLPGLFAVGEVARTGVHGANRLASNSLLEGAVFATRAVAALEASETAVPRESHTTPKGHCPAPATPDVPAQPDAPATPFSREALQQLMWKHVGLLRTPDGIATAQRTLQAWSEAYSTPRTVSEHEDINLLTVAVAMAGAAAARPVSVGAHYLDSTPALIGT